MTKGEKIILATVLIGLGVACRLLPHFWNFAPITGLALFAGTYLGKRYAFFVPLSAMLIGDCFLGFYSLPMMLTVYGCFALIGLVGVALQYHKKWSTVMIASLSSSFIFFLATNWAVWQFSPWYEKSASGLLYCYALALPFFRGTLLGDLFYTAVLFGAYEALKYGLPRKISAVRAENR